MEKPNIDLKNTTAVFVDNSPIFVEGILMRKVSKFLVGSNEDGYIPVPMFYNPKTNKILLETLPPDLREEYKKYNDSI